MASVNRAIAKPARSAVALPNHGWALAVVEASVHACAFVQDAMGEQALTAVVATRPGEDEQPEVHFEVRLRPRPRLK